jgi:transposase
MAYREVAMVDVKEVLRLWLEGMARKRIAAQVGLDPKTVRRYVRTALRAGLRPSDGVATLTDERVAVVLVALKAVPTRPHGAAWVECVRHEATIGAYLRQGVRLTKIRKLLRRQGVELPYATLRRFAIAALGFGRTAPTVPVADCAPGEEVQLDTGWMILLAPDAAGRRRRFRAWIFTPVYSRYRFVYPCFGETTASAIEACEAAWAFYGGVFRVVIPDNTKAIIDTADPLQPRVIVAFREYAQARGFHVDPTRVRHARDKARVERSVPRVREDCFGGEVLRDLAAARTHAVTWCRDDYGVHVHTRTQRRPREQFEAEEQPHLRPAPMEPYDIPQWATPRVARDHFAQVAKALYTLPTRLIGQTLTARADRALVRFYHRGALIKVHVRQPPGGKAIDPSDFPPEKTAYALRDVAFLQRQAAEHGAAIGRLAQALLEGPLPWTRMRQVYALLGLVRRFGAARVEAVCADAVAVELYDVRRLKRMLEHATPPEPVRTAVAAVLPARFLRPTEQYALRPSDPVPEGGAA